MKNSYELNPILGRILTKAEAGTVLSSFLNWPLAVIDDGEGGVVVQIDNIDQLDGGDLQQLAILQELHLQSVLAGNQVKELRYSNHTTMLAIFMDCAVGNLIPWYKKHAPIIAEQEKRKAAMDTLFEDVRESGALDAALRSLTSESIRKIFSGSQDEEINSDGSTGNA